MSGLPPGYMGERRKKKHFLLCESVCLTAISPFLCPIGFLFCFPPLKVCVCMCEEIHWLVLLSMYMYIISLIFVKKKLFGWSQDTGHLEYCMQ